MNKGRASEQHRFKSVLQKNGKINGGGSKTNRGRDGVGGFLQDLYCDHLPNRWINSVEGIALSYGSFSYYACLADLTGQP